MEARSGGSFRILPEKDEKIKSEQKIDVIHDLMQASAYEAVLRFEMDDDDTDEIDMIRMVPTPKLDSNFNSDLDPNHSLEQVIHNNIDSTFTDFDLSFLPSAGECCDLDELPDSSSIVELSLSPYSPSDQALSPNLVTDLDCGATMFSPSSSYDPKKPILNNSQPYNSGYMESPPRYVPVASPLSNAPSSPYSPGVRPIRLSTDSVNTNSSMSQDLAELQDLQRQIQPPGSVLRRALVDGSLRLYPGENMEGVKNEGYEDPKLASVLSMVMDHLDMDPVEQLREDIQSQCSLLNISPDPQCWGQAAVVTWLNHKMQELNIPVESSKPVLQWAGNFEGPGFVQIPEEEFKNRLPEGGDKIYNTLVMWKGAASCYNNGNNEAVQHPMASPAPTYQPPMESSEVFDVMDVLEMCDNYPPPPPAYSEVTRSRLTQPPTASNPHTAPPSFEPVNVSSLDKPMPPIEDLLQSEPQQVQPPPPPYPGSSNLTTLGHVPPSSQHSTTHDLPEDDDPEDNADGDDPMSPCSSKSGPIRGSSSNIHLWQFVKDLLNQPQHSGAIHWVDRDQGIFKIVDSVRVAELWGKRKNRPAMNFDKLSRSLRQYYKKGIMKKTSRPQRLVYQFCSPYHL